MITVESTDASLPPHSLESERCLIGSVVCDRETLGTCYRMGLKPEMFYGAWTRLVYGLLLEMRGDMRPIDDMTVFEEIRARGWFESGKVPYPDYSESLDYRAGFAVEYYAGTIIDHYRARKVMGLCTETIQKFSGASDMDTDELANEFSDQVKNLPKGAMSADGETTMEAMRKVIDEVEDQFQNQGRVPGIPTGFPDLDHYLGGLSGKCLYVLAARPSLGKTAFMLNIAANMATRTPAVPVGILSMETSRHNVLKRMVCAESKVSMTDINRGWLNDVKIQWITVATARIGRAPIYIDDRSGLKISEIEAVVDRWVKDHGIRCLFVDYIQLAKTDRESRSMTRFMEVTDVSMGFQKICMNYNLPVVCISQLSREVERANRPPVLADLRESGQLEQDAYMIGFLYQDSRNQNDTDPESATRDYAPVNLKIAKNKDGALGVVNLTFMKPYMRFESAARVCPDDEEAPML